MIADEESVTCQRPDRCSIFGRERRRRLGINDPAPDWRPDAPEEHDDEQLGGAKVDDEVVKDLAEVFHARLKMLGREPAAFGAELLRQVDGLDPRPLVSPSARS